MEYKFKKNLGRKISSFFLILSIVSSTLYLPALTPRTHAFWGVGDINIESVPVIARFILDAIAVPIAQQMVDQIVKETVDWANTGFEGGPAYVTDTRSYFTGVADDIAGEFIAGSDLGFLCSPFQASIRISLQHQYYQPSDRNPYQCTLTGVTGNIDDFFNGAFNSGGGWKAWFVATQNPTNNPYGAYLTAKADVDQRIASKVGVTQAEYLVNQGFKSFSACRANNPSEAVMKAYQSGDYKDPSKQNGLSAEQADAYLKAGMIARGKLDYDGSKPADACIKDGAIKTAGATIKSQLDQVLPAGLDRLIGVEHIEQLVGAFASGILQRYVFSDKGTFTSDAKNSYSRELFDVDKDGIPDGWDTDRDNNLNICAHGLKDPNLPASNANCTFSKDAKTSPYFTPMCEALANTTNDVENYFNFITRGDFNKIQANTWANRTTSVQGRINGLSIMLTKLEIVQLDNTIFKLDEYGKHLDKITRSLVKDGKLPSPSKWKRAFSAFVPVFGIIYNIRAELSNEQKKLIENTGNILDFLKKSQSAMGQCNNPNIEGLTNVPPPAVDPGEEEGEDGTVDTTTTTTPTDSDNDQGSLSCSASPSEAVASGDVGSATPVTWTFVDTNLDGQYRYEWVLDSDHSVYDTTNSSITVTYSEPGEKFGSIIAIPLEPGLQSAYTTCSDTVIAEED